MQEPTRDWASLLRRRAFLKRTAMGLGTVALGSLLDPKLLAAMDGKPMPESMTKGQQLAQLQGAKLICYGPQTKFKRFGQSGAEICELFKETGSVADDICIIR